MKILCRYAVQAGCGPAGPAPKGWWTNYSPEAFAERLPREVCADNLEDALEKYRDAWRMERARFLKEEEARVAERRAAERCEYGDWDERLARWRREIPEEPFFIRVELVSTIVA